MAKLYFIITLLMLPIFTFANESVECGNNKQALALVKLIKADKEQQRTNIRCNSILTKAAVAKAEKMAEFGLVVHNLGGSPNSFLREANYVLPSYYGSDFDSNQVEAVAGGYSNSTEVWKAFKNSKAHRSHLLGEHKFYKEQDEIGVAFIKNRESPHVEYWVVYLTKGNQANQSISDKFSDIPNKSLYILQQAKKEITQ
ncbi:CAP domain-containing protein [Thalassotalea nanhaiensis]|uniref:CAP domain-containing protein n=1 Tax=Thalassotalea nanhaiensis TaxID=3065648 RepID=A0ABY9TIS1_9GAMM|nr:CAP domain-containing protein [Colwelliaceae bacterium SQ345]